MTTYEYTYLWWEGSTTSTIDGRLGVTTPPIGEEVIDKINSLAADGWEIDQITAVPLTTGWISPEGRIGTTGITNKVHYLSMLMRPRNWNDFAELGEPDPRSPGTVERMLLQTGL